MTVLLVHTHQICYSGPHLPLAHFMHRSDFALHYIRKRSLYAIGQNGWCTSGCTRKCKPLCSFWGARTGWGGKLGRRHVGEQGRDRPEVGGWVSEGLCGGGWVGGGGRGPRRAHLRQGPPEKKAFTQKVSLQPYLNAAHVKQGLIPRLRHSLHCFQ